MEDLINVFRSKEEENEGFFEGLLSIENLTEVFRSIVDLKIAFSPVGELKKAFRSIEVLKNVFFIQKMFMFFMARKIKEGIQVCRRPKDGY